MRALVTLSAQLGRLAWRVKLDSLKRDLTDVERRIEELDRYRGNGTRFLASLQCDKLREKWRQTIRTAVSRINREWLERLDEAEWLRSRIRELSGD